MTNYDKHKNEILKLAKERYSDLYAAEALAAHDISGLADADNVIKWLFDEYEPLLLKNGDGLKPGDWIMVRNYTHDDWKKVRFMCYFDGYFFATETFVRAINYKTCSVFTQARLPKDGE